MSGLGTASPPPEAALAVLRTLRGAGFEAFFVGGCVRDQLLGRPVGDWDVTTDAHPEQVVPLFPRVVPTGLAHGTVTVVEDGQNFEVTTYRVDLGYTDGRRPDGVAFTRSLEEDLARRDFTMNAMAWEPFADQLVDLHGGREDLERGLIRAVGSPEVRFREDGLRALRAVRFGAVLNLEIEPETLAAITRTLDVFARVSAERVQVELKKLLLSARPGWGTRTLADSGLLTGFFAGYPLAEVPGIAVALEASVARLPVRLGVFLWPLDGGLVGAVDTLRVSNQLRTEVLAVARSRASVPEAAQSPAEVRALVAAIGRDALDDTLALHEALGQDAWIRFGARAEAYGARTCPLSTRELALSGLEVMDRLSLRPSRVIGQVLDALLRRVWVTPEANTPEALAEWLPAVYAEISGESAPK